MNFEYSDEQKMLKQSIERWAQDNYSFDQRRVILASDDGFSHEHWKTFAELGWLSVPFAEEYGGYGGGIIDLAAIMEEFGKALLVEPIVANLVLFGGLLQKAGGDQANTLIPQIIGGHLLGSLATYEPQARFNLSNVETTAERNDVGFVINGQKALAAGGAHADQFIVSARVAGGATDKMGIRLFLVPSDAVGLTVASNKMMDGQHVADLTLTDVQVSASQQIGGDEEGCAWLDATMQDANIALSAEAIGIMHTLNAATIEYTKTRKQFGLPISGFQALQHRMVDCFMGFEQSKSMLFGTLCELSDGITPADQARQTVLGLRVLIAKYGKQVADEAIQMHGGMGITDELAVSHYAKRLLMINLQFGNGDFFQQQYNQLSYQRIEAQQ